MSALAWQRPLALALLALPILVLIFARIFARPEPEATGTLEIWRRAEARAPSTGSRAHARIPPSIVWLALALVFAVLALAGPRVGSASPKSCIVVVDRSPSMYVGDRLQKALEQVRVVLARESVVDVEWIAPPSFDRARGTDVPRAWLVAPRIPRAAPDFAAHDATATLWVTDRAPIVAPTHAGFVASGGLAVPGPVAVRDGQRIDWDGTKLNISATASALPQVRIENEVPAPIARVLGAWAHARGYPTSANSNDGANALVLRGIADMSAAHDVEFGRDGWAARGRALSAKTIDDDGPLERWLADASDTTTLVAAAAGRIEVGLVTCEEPRGDPASFAVSWSRLFDACVLLPPDCVVVSERADAGTRVVRVPDFGESSGNSAANSLPAWLALVATASGLAALAVGSRAWGRPVHETASARVSKALTQSPKQ